MKVWIKEHRYLKIAEMIKQINIKLRGHYQYYGITDNDNSINLFKRCINKLLWKWLNRRSERKSYKNEQFKIVMKQNPLLTPKIYINIYDV
ncbi:MAG: group II intron maturase-specific domain-containing protein [Clostridia bacterium]|jgi:RNA-directed DNA polymerase